MNPGLEAFLYYHRELSFAAAKVCGISTVSAEKAFEKFTKRFIDPTVDLDDLDKVLPKKKIVMDHSLFSKDSHDLLLKLLIEDKRYQSKYIKSISAFYVEVLGQNPEEFFKYCLNSSELRSTVLGENKTLTNFEKLLTFFYCMRVYAKTDQAFDLSEKQFLNSLASHLDLDIADAEFWLDVRNHERNFPQKISGLLSTKDERLAFIGLIALATSEDGQFDESEKTILKDYVSQLSLTFNDLLDLKKSGGIKLESLVAKIPSSAHSYVLLLLIDCIFVDKKIHKREVDVIAEFLNLDGIKLSVVHLMQLYKQTLLHLSTLDKDHEQLIRDLAKVFNQYSMNLKQRSMIFYMVETGLNFSHRLILSNSELHKCLALLGFDDSSIPGLVIECEALFKMGDTRSQMLTYVESIHALNSEQSLPLKTLIPMLNSLLEKYPVNKVKLLNFVVDLVMRDGKIWSGEAQLLENLSKDFEIYKLELSELGFYLGLCSGDSERVKFGFAPDVVKTLKRKKF